MSELVGAEEFERLRTSAGFAMPVEAMEGFPLARGLTRTRLVNVPANAQGWGGVAEYAPSRVAPWRTVLRMIRTPGLVSSDVGENVTAAISWLADECKALRIHVELYELDAARRERLETALTAAGFSRALQPRRYDRTIMIDLSRSEEELLASFHKTCRSNIRSFSRKALRCLPIDDPALAPRLQQLMDETMSRTNGTSKVRAWPDIMAFIARNPSRARLLGAFRSDISGPEALVGYVFGVRHSDAVEYALAASTRLADLKVSFLYSPAWELMRWAKSVGAKQFDFGGVIPSTASTDDPRYGISRFKHMFSGVEVEVGTEYIREAPDVVARAVRVVRNLGK